MSLKRLIIVFVFSCVVSCSQVKNKQGSLVYVESPGLNLEEANRLSHLPLYCIDVEYPYRLGQTLGGPEDLLSPKTLHPAFYGCFEWHSAVHGHWSLHGY